ncbi:hypothetical protein P154DRAFT_424264 [Amniculicola lignicola CBS 123094]|uniref:DUF7924 domain-containing protein n=1 Tax=Amniculicola lignicola CBS 123094 TaxID=1392246 RepID=A0A6A5WWL6_9PLEO|nr:hypothetical protein P154DRAFT_424264 [Amniculicola lignicola CBS 123094]
MPPQRTASPSRNASGANIDEKQKLDAYNIRFDIGAALPPELNNHIDVVVKKARDGPASPNAQRIVEKRRRAALQNEATGIAALERSLLFDGQAGDVENGVQLLEKKANVNFNRYFLPDAPSKMVKSSWGALSMPQPDRALGYVTRMDAQMSGAEVQVPFSEDEEQIADWYRLSIRGDLHFPFLTAQFKSLSGGDTIFHANCQSARDGAIITNYLHRFYSIAYAKQNPPRAPSVVETCHFSLTCEMWSLALWVHWREVDKNGTVQYRMEMIYSATLRELDPLLATRRMLRNIVDWSLNERLFSIKAALPLFWDNPERPPQPTEERGSNSSSVRTRSGSVAGSLMSAEVMFAPPMTPSSETGDAVGANKRRRLAGEG